MPMILETIKNRRAVYPAQYNQDPISREEIESILEAANWAPTHRRTEPWRFTVFHGPSQKKLGVVLSETYKKTTEKFSERSYNNLLNRPVEAGCVIAVCMQRDPENRVPEWEELAAVSMAVQNMWLAASHLKIGSYLSTPAVVAHLDSFLNLQDGERVLGLFYMGKYDGPLPEGSRNSPASEKTVWID